MHVQTREHCAREPHGPASNARSETDSLTATSPFSLRPGAENEPPRLRSCGVPATGASDASCSLLMQNRGRADCKKEGRGGREGGGGVRKAHSALAFHATRLRALPAAGGFRGARAHLVARGHGNRCNGSSALVFEGCPPAACACNGAKAPFAASHPCSQCEATCVLWWQILRAPRPHMWWGTLVFSPKQAPSDSM